MTINNHHWKREREHNYTQNFISIPLTQTSILLTKINIGRKPTNFQGNNFEKLGSDRKLIFEEQKKYFNNNLYFYYSKRSHQVEANLYYPSENTRL